MLEALEQAVEEQLWPDGELLAKALSLADRLDAKIAAAFAGFESAGLWQGTGATSAVAWLRSSAEMTSRGGGPLRGAGPAPGTAAGMLGRRR